MLKIEKIKYAILAVLLLASNSTALAQWGRGRDNAKLSELPGADATTATITAIVTMVMRWLLGITGMIGIIGFAIAGILYLTSAGDDGKMETAKKAMIYSIIGVVVALMGYVMILAVETMLSGTDNRF